MDSYQQPHRYMRPPPPPPSMAGDPNLHHHPPPPPPPSSSWFSGQFQYHPPQSPSPPPPQQQQQPVQQSQWGPYHGNPNPNPNNANVNVHSYPTQPYAPPPPLPPPPPRPSQVPPHYPPYSHPTQDWGNTNWSHHSSWEHQGHSNEEDWAARARAWASARSAMENQHPQSQFTAIARPEEPSHYPNHYSQPFESHYHDGQQTSLPAPGFQNYQAPVAPLRPPMVHQQEPASISSYAPEGHFSFTPKDGALGGDMNAAFSHHEGSSSSSVHQQEVPSSYSSVPGKEEGADGRQHGHSLFLGDGRAVQMEQAQFAYGNHSVDPMDQPLDFVPRSSHENDSKIRSGYPDKLGPAVGTDSVGAVSSLHAWTAPAAVSPGISYPPPIAPAFPSALQHDPSMSVPPLPGQPAPMFGRGPNFQPTVPPITPPVGLGAGTTLHPTSAFPVDAYGGSLGSERSKKAAVPNWLREEIIKKKATFTSSVAENSKEGRKSIEDESIDKSMGRGDQADSRSMDSSKSTEEEDDDEDYEEAQRIAAINQEIKRVLTEVLLKVTDELFDEIATKVLSEDDATADVKADLDNNVPSSNASPPPVPTPKASVKLLVPIKGKESEPENSSGESSSGLPGNVFGLVNYASDDNEDEHRTSSMPKSDNGADEDGHPQPEVGEHSRKLSNTEGGNGSSMGAQGNHDTIASKLGDRKIDDKDLDNGEAHQAHPKSAASLGKKGDSVADNRKSPVISDATESITKSRKASATSTGVPAKELNSRKLRDDDSPELDARRHNKHESRSSSGRDKERVDEKAEGPGRREERHQKKDKAQDNNSSKERLKEQGGKHREKTKESDSRKRSPHYDDKDSKKERKTIDKDVADKKRERTKDEKGDRSRHKSSSDRGRHKRRRSSSVNSRGKRSKESPVVSDGSVDDSTEDSRRKARSKRRNLSPSPDRSKGRHISKSPSSKRSERRHSPYSSLDNNRGRRSRSRSPVRRRR